MPVGVGARFSRHGSTDGQPTTANLALEEVLRLGAAVTLFPVPVTVFNFPCELLKEGVGWSWLSVLPSPLLVLSASEDQ